MSAGDGRGDYAVVATSDHEYLHNTEAVDRITREQEEEDEEEEGEEEEVEDKGRWWPHTALAPLSIGPATLVFVAGTVLGIVAGCGFLSVSALLDSSSRQLHYHSPLLNHSQSQSQAPSAGLVELLEARVAAYQGLNPTWQRIVGNLSANASADYRRAVSTLPPCGVLTGREAGSWGLSASTARLQYLPAHCVLRRPTSEQALRCLSSQSLHFLGDSLLRYQYISLVSFLTHGDWPERVGSVPGSPSPVIEIEHGSWPAYFNALAAHFGGSEHCGDCRREVPNHWERRHWHHSGLNITVRHLFVTTLPSMAAGLQDIANEHAAAGQSPPPSSSSTPYRYSTNSHFISPVPCYSNSTAPDCSYPSSVPFHPPSLLLANIGLWYFLSGTSFVGAFSTARDFLAPDMPIRRIWRNRTPGRGGRDRPWAAEEDATFANTSNVPVQHGWDVLDVLGMTIQQPVQDAYWDPHHFLPFTYEEINVRLLNMLCDEQWRWVSK